jgi:ubiquinone/menaquinone biosynthesis C-methylase UbiE
VLKQHERKNFDQEAAAWDRKPGRVALAHDVADAIISSAGLRKDMDVLDMGCGTGLVTLRLQPHVHTITGADSSPGMLAVLETKVREQKIANVRTQVVDFEQGGTAAGSYDLIVSSMMLHHLPEPAALLRQMHGLLKQNGRLCVADLDAEDGSFHADRTGVFHFGFDRARLKQLLQQSGFRDVSDRTASTIVREGAESGRKEFSVFLICAKT